MSGVRGEKMVLSLLFDKYLYPQASGLNRLWIRSPNDQPLSLAQWAVEPGTRWGRAPGFWWRFTLWGLDVTSWVMNRNERGSGRHVDPGRYFATAFLYLYPKCVAVSAPFPSCKDNASVVLRCWYTLGTGTEDVCERDACSCRPRGCTNSWGHAAG